MFLKTLRRTILRTAKVLPTKWYKAASAAYRLLFTPANIKTRDAIYSNLKINMHVEKKIRVKKCIETRNYLADEVA